MNQRKLIRPVLLLNSNPEKKSHSVFKKAFEELTHSTIEKFQKKARHSALENEESWFYQCWQLTIDSDSDVSLYKLRTYELSFCQDDAAPDSMETFDDKMLSVTGFNTNDFENKASYAELDELTMQWVLGRFCLMYHGDDPFYKLYEEFNVE